jgi:hypothetical protein
MNYKVILVLIAICIALVGVEAFLIGHADAADSNYTVVNASSIVDPIVSEPTPEPTPVALRNQSPYFAPYKNNTRIIQGQCVEIGGVYDVSGVIGWTTLLDYNAFGYYNRYQDAYDPFDNSTLTYTLKMPNNRKGYFQFYIDPDVFNNREGYWYQQSGNYERAANKRAFYVSEQCIKPVNETVFVDVDNKPILINPKVIETKHVSDILLSNDDPLYLNMTGLYRVWVFGNTKSILSRETYLNESRPVLSQRESRPLTEGSYSLLLQNYGADSRYGVDYVESDRNSEPLKQLVPSLRSQQVADVTGLQPRMVEEKLTNILDGTDDVYYTYKMEVQEPYVSIDGYQEIKINNKSVLEVTGYTNKMPGTPVTLYIDRENQTKQSIKFPSMTIMVDNGSIGDYRTFHGYLPLMYDNIPPGEHQLTAVLPSGITSQVSFYVRAELEPNHQDPKYYQWIDGQPFVPTPTPIVIEKEVVKEVTKEVVVVKTVNIPVDYNTLAEETLWKAIPIIAGVVIVGIPLVYAGILVIRVYAERRARKKEEVLK